MENLFIDLGAALWQLFQPILAALFPLLSGLVLAWFLSPAVQRLKPHLGPRWAISVTYIIFFLSLVIAAGSFIILILGALPTGTLADTAAAISVYFQDAMDSLSSFCSKYLPEGIRSAMAPEAGLQNWLSQKLSLQSLFSAAASLSGTAVSLFLGVIVSIYLLKDQEFFLLLWNRFLSLMLSQRTHGIINEFLHEINAVLSAFLKGALIDSLLVGLLSSAVLSFLRIDFAVIIGIWGGLLNIIPYFGPIIGMLPAFLVALLQYGPAKSILTVVSLLLIQQIDSNFLYPHIVGTTIGLHPLFILLSVSTFGYFFGLTGMLLAVPAAGIIQIFIRKAAYK